MDEKIRELKLLANKAYGLSCILKEHCKINSSSIEEIANLYHLIKYLHKNIDKLNSIFIEIENV